MGRKRKDTVNVISLLDPEEEVIPKSKKLSKNNLKNDVSNEEIMMLIDKEMKKDKKKNKSKFEKEIKIKNKDKKDTTDIYLNIKVSLNSADKKQSKEPIKKNEDKVKLTRRKDKSERKKALRKKNLDNNTPKRGRSGYILYSTYRRPLLYNKNPELNHKEIVSIMAREWKNLSFDKKKPFLDQSKIEQERYRKEKLALANRNNKSKEDIIVID